MNIRDIIELRDRLKNDLAVVEKFLVIAKRLGTPEDDLPLLKTTHARTNGGATVKVGDEHTAGGYGSVGKSVVEAIKLCPSEFTVTDVDDALRRHMNRPLDRTQISTVLARLTKQSRVEVIKAKHGRRAAVYRKA